MQPTTKFTLIHGTFSARATWICESEDRRPDSFRSRLRDSMGNKVEFDIPKPWGTTGLTGKVFDLTNRARLKGAQQLKEHILRQPSQGNQKHYLLAHSHGGNVALYAMQDPEVQKRIDGIICMATPFLFPRIRPLSITTLSLSLSLLIMLIGVCQFIWKIDFSAHGWLSWFGSTALVIVSLVIPACLIWLIAKVRFERTSDGAHKLLHHVDSLSYQDPDTPILLVRSSGDEASGLLRSTQFLNWMAGMIMRIAGKGFYPLICSLILVVLLMGYLEVSWLPSGLLSSLNTSLIIVSALMVVMLMALTLSRVSVGLDAWRWVGEIETMVEDGPPGIKSELVVITPRQPKQGLSHTAVYSEPETTRAISNWCKETELVESR